MDVKKRVMEKKPTKHMWKPEEDLILRKYVETHGEGNWATVSQQSGLMRDGKSCRLRWKNYLRPNIKLGDMSQEEEDLIVRMHKLLGNRWTLIAGRLPGRTDNEVKNYWNTHLNKTRPRCKRKRINNIDHGQDSETKSKKNKTEDSQLVASESQKVTEDKMEDGRRKDEENETTLFFPSMTEDTRSFNYNMESPIMSCHGSMVMFDDEPFVTYMDSYLLFEAFGYNDNSTGENLAESSVQSFIP